MWTGRGCAPAAKFILPVACLLGGSPQGAIAVVLEARVRSVWLGRRRRTTFGVELLPLVLPPEVQATRDLVAGRAATPLRVAQN
jgi:hypothetical protein